MIDLHCHSTYSDGIFTPEQLLNKAKKIGLKLFSITDHDSLIGTRKAQEISSEYPFLYLTGIEISARYRGKKIEILGYNFDPYNKQFSDKLKFLQEKRRERISKILEKLNELDLNLDYNEIMNEIGSASSPGRPHFARAMLKKGYVKTINEAFDKWLAEGRPAYVKRTTITPEEAIKLVHQAGGISVLPHPLLIEAENIENLKRTLELLLSWGLQGIELFYNYSKTLDDSSPNKIRLITKFLKEFCEKNDLIRTAGSDYHGDFGELGDVSQPRNLDKEIMNFIQRHTRKTIL